MIPHRCGDVKPNPEARSYTRFIRPGMLDAATIIGARIDDERTILIEAAELEARIIETVTRLGEIVAGVGLDGPLIVAVSLEGVEDVQIGSGYRTSRPLRRPAMWLPRPRSPQPQRFQSRPFVRSSRRSDWAQVLRKDPLFIDGKGGQRAPVARCLNQQ